MSYIPLQVRQQNANLTEAKLFLKPPTHSIQEDSDIFVRLVETYEPHEKYKCESLLDNSTRAELIRHTCIRVVTIFPIGVTKVFVTYSGS